MMQSLRWILVAAPVAGLLAQTPPPPRSKTIPLQIQGAPQNGKTPTVTLTEVQPPSLPNVPPDQVVMSIGDQKITAAEFGRIIDALPEQYRAAARGPQRAMFAKNIANVMAYAAEARRRKLDQTPAFEFQKDNLLASVLYQNLMAQSKPTDEDLRKYYEQHKSEFEQVQARHILIRMKGSPVPVKPEEKDLTPEEALAKAQEIRKKLASGGDFAAIAKSESDDAGSGAQGGELGTFHHGQMVPSFEQAAFSLPVGEISEPVKSQFGYHLIQVEKHESRPFEEVKPELEKRLAPEAAQKAMEEIAKQANVTLNPEYFPPAPPAPPKPAAPAPPPASK